MLLQKLKSKSQGAAIAAHPQYLTLDNPVGWLPDGGDAAISPEAALKLSAVYGGVQYISDFVSALPVYVYDNDNRQRIADHPLNHVLNLRPNEAQTPSDFTQFMIRSYILRGNAVAYNYRDPNRGCVVERIPLHPDCVCVQILEGRLYYFYTHPTSGELYCLDPSDVTHYKMPGQNCYWGESVLRHAARTLRTAQAAAEYESAVYVNNARPGGVLYTDANLSGPSDVPDPDNKEQMLSKKEVIRRAWYRAHGGANTLRTAVLDLGLKYQPIKIDAYDASFVESKDVSVADIARFLGVPLHALMAGKQSFSSNEQNSLEFVQGRGLAILRMMEEEDSYKLLPDFELAKNYRIKHNLDGRLRGDSAARANLYRVMHDIGAYSVNDILALEDRPDVPGGDIRLASLNYIPLDRFEELSVARNTNKEVEQ